jgi:hypothetical protein
MPPTLEIPVDEPAGRQERVQFTATVRDQPPFGAPARMSLHPKRDERIDARRAASWGERSCKPPVGTCSDRMN